MLEGLRELVGFQFALLGFFKAHFELANSFPKLVDFSVLFLEVLGDLSDVGLLLLSALVNVLVYEVEVLHSCGLALRGLACSASREHG